MRFFFFNDNDNDNDDDDVTNECTKFLISVFSRIYYRRGGGLAERPLRGMIKYFLLHLDIRFTKHCAISVPTNSLV